jgi:hypothetical protein
MQVCDSSRWLKRWSAGRYFVKPITNIANSFQVAKSVHAAGSAFVSVTMFYKKR